MAPTLEPMIGRYLRMEIDRVPHRIYFEEAGQGLPLVCLHTPPAPTTASSAICWPTPRSRGASAYWPSTCRGTASRRRPTVGKPANTG
jgi:hypothetical protein